MAEVSYLGLDRGWSSIRPPRSLRPDGEGEVWAEAVNVRFLDGYVRRRPSLRELDDAPVTGGYPTEVPVYPAIVNNAPGVNGGTENGQIPLQIYPQLVSPLSNGQSLVVTSREIHRLRNGVWDNLTPTYEVGTAALVGTTVTGTGTTWSASSIQPGNIYNGGTGDAIIASVDSDTQLTLATAPGDHADGAYSVRRNFVQYGLQGPDTQGPGGALWDTPILSRLFNGSLYVSGELIGHHDLMVMRVRDCFSSTPVIEYLTGTINPDPATLPGFDTLALGDDAIITGLELLDDGRVSISINDELNQSRIHFSDADTADQKDWTTQFGGFLDVVTHQTALRTIRRFGGQLACHFDDGVAMATLTGLAFSPLAVQRTRATTGAINQTTVHELPGGSQIYLSRDGHAHLFDGSTSQELGGPIRRTLAQVPLKVLLLHSHVSWNAHDQEVSFWVPTPPNLTRSGSAVDWRRESIEFCWNQDTQTWAIRHVRGWVGSVSDTMWGYNNVVDGRIPHGYGWVGVPSVFELDDPGGDPFVATNMLYKFLDGDSPDTDLSNPGSDSLEDARRTEVESDDIMAAPGQRLNIKRVSLVAWSPEVRQEVVTVGVSFDGGFTWTDQDRTLGLSWQEDRLFHYEQLGNGSDEKVRFRVQWPLSGDTLMRLGQVHVELDEVAQDKAQQRFRIEDLAGMEFWARHEEIDMPTGTNFLDAQFIWGVTTRRMDEISAPGGLVFSADGRKYLAVEEATIGFSTPLQFSLSRMSLFYRFYTSGGAGGTPEYRLAHGGASSLLRVLADGSVELTTEGAGPTLIAAAGAVDTTDGSRVLAVFRDTLNNVQVQAEGVDVTSGSPSLSGLFQVDQIAGGHAAASGALRVSDVLIFEVDHSASTQPITSTLQV